MMAGVVLVAEAVEAVLVLVLVLVAGEVMILGMFALNVGGTNRTCLFQSGTVHEYVHVLVPYVPRPHS